MILTLGQESLTESRKISHVVRLSCECKIKGYNFQSLYSKHTCNLSLSEPAPYPRLVLRNSETIQRRHLFEI